MGLLEDVLIREEDVRLRAYPDSKGLLTIGVGRCIDGRVPGAGLTREEALYLLANDVARVRRAVLALFPWVVDLDDVRRAVVEAMAFQLGTGGLLGFHYFLVALEAGDYARAASEMLDSDWARQDSPLRAQRMADAMSSGKLEA